MISFPRCESSVPLTVEAHNQRKYKCSVFDANSAHGMYEVTSPLNVGDMRINEWWL